MRPTVFALLLAFHSAYSSTAEPITGETRLSGRDIGTINIAESHAIVEIPDDAVDEVIDAMRRTTIRGKKVKARRDRLDG